MKFKNSSFNKAYTFPFEYQNQIRMNISPHKRFIPFHPKRHPNEMGAAGVVQFLNHLALKEHVSASTQNQALCAIGFLYKQVLHCHPGDFGNFIWAKKPKKIPVVFTRQEVKALLTQLSVVHWIMANLLYGAGLRLSECLRLRVKDIDFEYNQIIVKDGKGEKDPMNTLPEAVKQPLQEHLKKVKRQHEKDLKAGFGTVFLPYSLERRYRNANKEWA